MTESLEINEKINIDFISEGSNIKMKEPVKMDSSLKPEGKIKIELFDEENNKVHEQKDHNFVSKGVMETLFRYQMLDVFIKDRIKTGYQGNEGIAVALGDLFQYIYLTTADHAEEPDKEWVMKGDLIGYADSTKTYSGSDPLIGTLNENESSLSQEQLRLVFDFSSDKANGTFNSIYFAQDRIHNNYDMLDKIPIDARNVIKYKGNYYVVAYSGRDIYVYDENFNEKDVLETDLNTWFTDFCIAKDHFYFSNSSSSYGIAKAPLSDPTDTEIIANEDAFGITYDSEESIFYVALKGDNGAIDIKSFDIDFKVIDVKSYDADTVSFEVLNKYDDGFFVDYYYLTGESQAHRVGYRSIIGIDDEHLFINRGHKAPHVWIGSRSLLDSPVTKTDSTTMKITYDFIFS